MMSGSNLTHAKKGSNAPTGDSPGLYGSVIRKYRIAHNIDQNTIAKEFGLHPNSVSNWERGISRPDLNYVTRLCEMLQMPITEFFGIDNGPVLSDDEQQLIGDYRKLPERLRAHALSAVHSLREYIDAEQSGHSLEYYRSAYISLPRREISAASGTGFPEGSAASEELMYVKTGSIACRADEIYTVNGHSMEPEFPNGSCVFAERTSELDYDETGIFLVDGSVYMKIYTPAGLKSLNTEYKLMRRSQYESIQIIGRVLGSVDPDSIARGMDLEKCIAAADELSR